MLPTPSMYCPSRFDSVPIRDHSPAPRWEWVHRTFVDHPVPATAEMLEYSCPLHLLFFEEGQDGVL